MSGGEGVGLGIQIGVRSVKDENGCFLTFHLKLTRLINNVNLGGAKIMHFNGKSVTVINPKLRRQV